MATLLTSSNTSASDYYKQMSRLYRALFKGATVVEFDTFFKCYYEHPRLIDSPIGYILAWGDHHKHISSIEVKFKLDLDNSKGYFILPKNFEVELPIA